MPWWASLYVAFIVMSLPFGISTIRRLEQDVLHPVGGVLSTLLSASFVVSYFYPDLLPYRGPQTWLIFIFVLGWDAYTFLRLKERLPELLDLPDETLDSPEYGDVDMQSMSFLIGLILILPAYIWGFLVCLRAV